MFFGSFNHHLPLLPPGPISDFLHVRRIKLAICLGCLVFFFRCRKKHGAPAHGRKTKCHVISYIIIHTCVCRFIYMHVCVVICIFHNYSSIIFYKSIIIQNNRDMSIALKDI